MQAFLKSSIAYFCGNVFSKLIIFFMLPLYTTYISPANYGYYDLTVTYIDFFASILFLDIWCGTLRFMFDSDQHEMKLKTVYSSMLIYIMSSTVYFIVFSILNLFSNIQFFPLVLLYGFCMTLQNWYGYIARGFGKSMLFAYSGVAATFTTVLLNIILICIFNVPYWSLYVASSLGILVQIIILERSVKLTTSFSSEFIDFDLTKQIFRYSLPLCLNSVAYWFLTSFNRVVIVNVLGETQNGYYAVANKFSVAINLIGSCFSLAWQETAFKKEGEHNTSDEFYTKASDLYIKFLFMGTICLLPLFGILFQFVINRSYASARDLIPISLLGAAVSLYSLFIGNIFGAIKENSVIFISTLAASLLNIIVIYLLIFRIGLQAANISLFLGFTLNCVIRIVMLQKKIGFHISLKPFLIYISLFSAETYVFLTQNFFVNLIGLLIAVAITLLLFKDTIRSFLSDANFNQFLLRKDSSDAKRNHA